MNQIEKSLINWHLIKLNDVEHENEPLVAKLSDSHALIDSVKYENCVLNEKVKWLENELQMSKNQLKKVFYWKTWVPVEFTKTS